jgi:hypothetical protein
MRNYNDQSISNNFFAFKEHLSHFGEVDIFVASWNYQNTQNCWSASHNLSLCDSYKIQIDPILISEHYKSVATKIFDYDFYSSDNSPLKYQYFTNNKYNWDERGIYNDIIHSTKMLFLIYEANLLKSVYANMLNITYDWVFRIRPDHLFDLKEIKEYIDLNKLDPDKLYMPGKNDRLAFGSNHNMNIYCSSIYRLINIFNNNIFGDPETVLQSCTKQLINIENIVYTPMFGHLLTENRQTQLRLR